MRNKKLLSLCLAFILAAAAVLFAGTDDAAAAGLFGNKDQKKIEGEGYRTPEEAIVAYLEGMKDQDVQKMISTFAVESVCENFDFPQLIDRMGAYSAYFTSSYPMPAEEKTLNAAVNIENRRAVIVDSINRQMLVLTAAENGYYTDHTDDTGIFQDLLSGKNIIISDKKEDAMKADKLIEALSKTPDYSKIEIKEVLYGEVLSDKYLEPKTMKNFYAQAKLAGADGYKSMALHASFDGYDILLFMDTLRYNGRWYNYQSGGAVATILDMDAYLQGIAVASPELAAQWDKGYAEIQKNLQEAKEDFLEDFEDEWEEYCEEIQDKEYEDDKAYTARLETEFAKMSSQDVVDFFALTELTDE